MTGTIEVDLKIEKRPVIDGTLTQSFNYHPEVDFVVVDSSGNTKPATWERGHSRSESSESSDVPADNPGE